MAHGYAVEDRQVAMPPTATSFVGSFPDKPDQAVIVLRGDIDAATVHRLGLHIDDFLAAASTRFITIDAAAVDSYDAALLDLLGRTQHRLGRTWGLLRVRGLHPALLAAPAPNPPPGPDPGSAGTAAAGAADIAPPHSVDRPPRRSGPPVPGQRVS